jgi:beta-galactosidase/beta-glucuronidase
MNSICRFWFIIGILSLSNLSAARGEDLSATPRPEHPQPQMVRAEWLNLNGSWEFAETDDAKDESWLLDKAKPYPDKIIVPFCRESSLSGLARTGFVKNVWYRRTFQKPADWKSQRVRLHIGACDWKTTVWINGQPAGEHVGGSVAFCFDITDLLKSGDNTVVIRAFDDTRSGLQATGKQTHSEKSQNCVYTRTTGIWQTVWLEGVGSAFVRDVRVEPDPTHSRILLQAEVDGPCDGLTLKAVALADGKEVGSAETPADWRNNLLVLDLSDKRLWSIESPFLYDLKISLLRDGQPVDSLNSYFGLRDVTIRGAAILINGMPVFQRTVLDQGFYPTGIWTAPSDADLRKDIELSQAVGFNGARLHQKVFEPRFLYWADKLGYIVWDEFPNWGLKYKDPRINLSVIDEWVEIVRRDRNHPSIVGWCPFNETPPDAGLVQNTVARITQAIDPARPVIDSSGYYHGLPNPDVLDFHDYDQNPTTFKKRWDDAFQSGTLAQKHRGVSRQKDLVPYFLSEYGGIGWNMKEGWGYGDAPKDLEAFYERFQGLTDAQLDNRDLFGYCYTQLTDVEQEQNGLYTYDRKPKFDVKRLHKIQTREAAYEKNPPLGLPKK